MASSPVSHEYVGNSFDQFDRKSRRRTARARQINTQVNKYRIAQYLTILYPGPQGGKLNHRSRPTENLAQ